MQRDDLVRLRHMLDAAKEAIGFAQGRSRADLESDRQLVLALVKAIEIVGEAAYQVSPSTRLQLPMIPWSDIIGMRHRLVHAYFDINMNVLWSTLHDDLPPLVTMLERIAPGSLDQ